MSVKALRPPAIIQTEVLGPLDVSPVFVPGVIYIVTAGEYVGAYDVACSNIL